MICVEQRKSEEGFQHGDCLSACIASILELPLGDVPVFSTGAYAGRDWRFAVNDWLRTRGYTLLGINEDVLMGTGPECYHIMCGPTDGPHSGPYNFHAVVGYGDRPVYDPNSNQYPLTSIDQRLFLLPTDWRHERRPVIRPWTWGHPMADNLYGYLMMVVAILVQVLSGTLPGSAF